MTLLSDRRQDTRAQFQFVRQSMATTGVGNNRRLIGSCCGAARGGAGRALCSGRGVQRVDSAEPD